jgi:hypothetical protein
MLLDHPKVPALPVLAHLLFNITGSPSVLFVFYTIMVRNEILANPKMGMEEDWV